ncbi:MAG TPA: hypothetical protein VKP11_08970, partial [Frankiaceae bacterium]|nr:hypothetical protein [Frankiaceae bacterium]
PDYRFDPASGLWHHRDGPVEPPLRLHQLRYDEDGRLRYPASHRRTPESALADHLRQARRVLAARPAPGDDDGRCGLPAEFEELRWFDLPPACLR